MSAPGPSLSAPEDSLRELAARLREEGSVISGHVGDPAAEPGLGLLAAAGPRAAAAPGEYALLVEAIREGYLLHYGEPRVVTGADPDLALLAGDYLYSLGLERLAELGDLPAVRELSDLISLAAQLHADGEGHERGETPEAGRLAKLLWVATVTAVAAGAGPEHERAKRALRAGDDAARALALSARSTAARAGISAAFERACEAIDLRLDEADLG